MATEGDQINEFLGQDKEESSTSNNRDVPCQPLPPTMQAGHPQNALMSSFHRLWEAYRSHVRKHQVLLHLGDDMLTRVLFWTPHSSHDTALMSRWREVLYGMLSLHRMAMDMAHQDHIMETYGTTLKPSEPPVVPATALRILLTVTHNLMPTVLELTRSVGRTRNPMGNDSRQAKARLWMERIKFVARSLLLISYWRQVRNERSNVVGGLLQDGGMYRVGREAAVPSVAQAQAQADRRAYVGRRTGRRVVAMDASSGDRQGQSLMWIRLIVGELLHASRPLYWASVEHSESESSDPQYLWRAWVVSLVMDLTSLECLSGAVSRENVYSQAEWNRRRMKLLLFFLRSPAWDKVTNPGVLRLAAAFRRVPLLGRLVETYLWEWLLYWKHPYFAEEE